MAFSLRKVPGAVWGLLALATGMVLGTLFPDQLGFIGTAVGAGFKGLAWLAPYIIFFTISAAIVDMLRHGKAGRFALWTTIVFTGIGLAAGLLAILLTVPLFGLSWSAGDATFADTLKSIGVETLLLTHSSPSFIAVFYAAGSVTLLHWLGKWKRAAWFTRPTMDVLAIVGRDGIQYVGRGLKVAFPYLLFGIGIFIPTAIARAVASSEAGLATAGPGVCAFNVLCTPVALYFATVALQVIVLAVFMVAAIVGICYFTGFSLKRFLREYFAYVYPFAWATSSSAASIPVNLERTGEGLKVRKEIREFVIPLGATVNLDGAIMASFVLTAMAAILVGYRPTFVDLLILLIPIKIVTLGVPGIPGGVAAVVPPVVSEILPIPEDAKAAFIAIWFGFSVGLSDQFRTGVNTTTNGIVALGFEKVYDRYFNKEAPVASAVAEEAPAAQLDEPPAGGA
ncbi:MAG TPA: cation:dicarboxylase symporter family transporter [Candidatus Thermoplasmatota archaeon]|nr:cation:dicarboxylase symporter family transporter [Candidatus Thermoplasmatota archaeon]